MPPPPKEGRPPMAADEHAGEVRRQPPQRSIDERAAVRRLEAALIEQARLGDRFQRSLGTSSEQASYASLQVASRRVSECDRAVRALSDEDPPTP